jgi:Fe-S-cluster containining protein
VVDEALTPIECFRCGLCCTRYQPPIVPDEVAAIAAGLGLSAADFLARYGQLTNVGYLLRQTSGQCVFLIREAASATCSCRIHPFRPRACRDWVASLSQRECREGLSRLKSAGNIILVKEIYPSPQASEQFSRELHPE